MNNVMIDIEAMDDKPTAAIASIAAAVFDPKTGNIDASMYRLVDIEISEKAGGTLGAETIKWWFKQSGEVREEVLSDEAVSISFALTDLNMFILSHCDMDNVRVWARGTDYDMPIIYSAMRAVDVSPAWKFWNVRDVRTVEEIALSVKGFASRRVVPGVKHRAITDVWNQIAQLVDNLQVIAGKDDKGAAL